jgi:hypothetical protein
MNLEAESLQTRPQFIQSVCRVRPPLLTNGERHIVVGSLRTLRHFLASIKTFERVVLLC